MGRLAVEESCGVVHAVSHGCKHILGQIRGSNVLQAFDREVMKGEDFVPILGQYGADPHSFAAMGVNEELQGSTDLLLRFRHPDILQLGPRFPTGGIKPPFRLFSNRCSVQVGLACNRTDRQAPSLQVVTHNNDP